VRELPYGLEYKYRKEQIEIRGILLAKFPFPNEIERFDNFTMDGDHIYFADPYGQACVYKYEVVWRD